MATSDSNTPSGTTMAPVQERPITQDTLDRRLEPLEEFRSRAESWMKEVTAQVARLASSFEQEEKRRETLEQRLADLDERIRSLLTLSELISLDKNPFAANGDDRHPEQKRTSDPADSGPSTTPEPHDTSPDRREAPAPEDPETRASAPQGIDPFRAASQGTRSSPGLSTPPSGQDEVRDHAPDPETDHVADQENDPDRTVQDPVHEDDLEAPPEPPAPAPSRQLDPGVEVIPVDDPAPKTPVTEDGTETAPPWSLERPGTETPHDAESTAPATPQTPTPPTSPTLVPEERERHHPNDASAEQEPRLQSPSGPETQAEAAEPETPQSAPDPTRPTTSDPETDAKTARRLLVIAWADLLAPMWDQIDVEAFTEFYVDAEWVDADTARLVDRLVHEMAPHVPHAEDCDLRRLHEKTIRLLARHDPALAAFSRVDEEDGAGSGGDADEGPTAHGGVTRAGEDPTTRTR